MKNTALFFVSFLSMITLLYASDASKRLENLSYAVRSGDLSQVDQLMSENHYSAAEYDMMIGDTERILIEARSWWFAVWIMMALGILIALMATLQALKLATKAPKYNSPVSIVSGIIILAIGSAGAYIAYKGYSKHGLYAKAPEMLLRLQAGRKQSSLPLSVEHYAKAEKR